MTVHKLGNVRAILEEDVDRKEFLQYIGIATLGVIGVTSVLKNLDDIFGRRRIETNTVNRVSSYGSSAYGR